MKQINQEQPQDPQQTPSQPRDQSKEHSVIQSTDSPRFTPQLFDDVCRVTTPLSSGQAAGSHLIKGPLQKTAQFTAMGECPPALAKPCTLQNWGIMDERELPSASAPVILCGDCASSLDVAWALVDMDRKAATGPGNRAEKLPVFGSVLALSQSSGRGQLRRHWLSPPGNIYAAWRLPLEGVLCSQGASVVLGFLFCRAFNALGLKLQLKWPNDLILERRKLGGILLEERNGVLMAGIGLNINSAPPEDLLRAGHAISATALCEHPQGEHFSDSTKITQSGLLGLWSALVQEALMAYKYKVLALENKTVFETAQEFLAFKNEKVKISELDTTQNLTIQGRIAGLTRDGSLRLLTADGGEISINSGSPVPSGF